MKRNKQNARQQRRRGKRHGSSVYKAKKDAGRQMYGPGCCGHTKRRAP